MPRTPYYFDGGSRPNPGPMEAAVVSRGETHFRDDLGQGDNNQAEWLALLFAVELALSHQATDVVFLGDSTLVIQQACGAWPCRSDQLKPYLAAFRRISEALPAYRLRYVPRSRNLAGIALAGRYL